MKLFGSIVMIIVFGFIGFFATIFASFTRGAQFYTMFIPIVTIGLIVLFILALYGKMGGKRSKVAIIVFLLFCFISIGGYESYQRYEASLEIVSTQDVDLSAYQPFVEGTKAVSLTEASSFTIKDHLPKLDGATALYPVYSAFAQAVYLKKDYPLEESEVVSTQTTGAFNRIVYGSADMVFLAKPSEEQMKQAEENGVELHLTPIGKEAFVFFVHSDNPVDELTVEQIQGIYTGEITNWSEVGGKDEEIRAFQRPEGSGSQSALIRMMDGEPLMEPPSEDIVSAMGGIITETTNYQNRTNAIGFSFRFFSQEMVDAGKIKYIAVNGVLPTKETIKNGTYPIVNELYAITNEANTNPNIAPFIEWILSDQGQEIVEKTGYVSIK